MNKLIALLFALAASFFALALVSAHHPWINAAALVSWFGTNATALVVVISTIGE